METAPIWSRQPLKNREMLNDGGFAFTTVQLQVIKQHSELVLILYLAAHHSAECAQGELLFVLLMLNYFVEALTSIKQEGGGSFK